MKKASIVFIQLFCLVASLSFNANAQTNCTYTLSPTRLISVTSTQGIGSGPVNFTVEPNPGAARQGVITVSGQSFMVFQDGVAGPVEIITGSGRVMSADNKPVRGALITFIHAATGEKQTVVTNQFGYFHQRVERGHQYNVLISHKRYKFSGTRGVTYFSGALIVIFRADPEQ